MNHLISPVWHFGQINMCLDLFVSCDSYKIPEKSNLRGIVSWFMMNVKWTVFDSTEGIVAFGFNHVNLILTIIQSECIWQSAVRSPWANTEA